jgi:t-SNARE complex subunit (syntaxin)
MKKWSEGFWKNISWCINLFFIGKEVITKIKDTYELIYQPNGVITKDWDGKHRITIQDINKTNKELEKENDFYENIIKESLKQLTEEDYAKIQEEEDNWTGDGVDRWLIQDKKDIKISLNLHIKDMDNYSGLF